MSRLVVDASAVVAALANDEGFKPVAQFDLVAPALMWNEAASALHQMAWRDAISRVDAETMLGRLRTAPVSKSNPKQLITQSWIVADEFGWARTYDAEYVALAQLLKCKLLTIDLRLQRGAERTGLVITPSELTRAK